MIAQADNHLISFRLNPLDSRVDLVDFLAGLADSRVVPVVSLVDLDLDSRVVPAVSLVDLDLDSQVVPVVSLVDLDLDSRVVPAVSLVDQAVLVGLIPKCQQHLRLRSLLLWRQR